MGQIINLGSTQAPYWEQTLTLKPNEHRKIDYVADAFELQYASNDDALKVSFGGTMIQTPFSAGMGYRMTEPVQFVELWNNSDATLTIKFVLAIGDIKDNRLTVSGVVNTKVVSTSGFTEVYGGTSSLEQILTLQPCQFDIMVTAGSVRITLSGGSSMGNVTSYRITDMIIPEGGSWSIQLALDSKVKITPLSGGVYNYVVGKY